MINNINYLSVVVLFWNDSEKTIKCLNSIEYKEKAFDYLVLEENKKDIIMCLVKNYKNEYKDFIVDKGEGIVLL